MWKSAILFLGVSFTPLWAHVGTLPQDGLHECTRDLCETVDDFRNLSSGDLAAYLALAQEQIRELAREKVQLERLITQLYSQSPTNARLSARDENTADEDFLSVVGKLPRKKKDLLKYIERVFGDRVVIHPNAQKSLEQSTFRNEMTMLRILFAMATDLYDLYFTLERTGTLEQAFKERTGFELAENESSFIRTHRSLSDARQFEYHGTRVRADAHVKYGNREPEVLRIHFYVDRVRDKIVIFHCGNHLPARDTKP